MRVRVREREIVRKRAQIQSKLTQHKTDLLKSNLFVAISCNVSSGDSTKLNKRLCDLKVDLVAQNHNAFTNCFERVRDREIERDTRLNDVNINRKQVYICIFL